MRFLVTAALSALVTFLVISLLADDPFGVLQAGERWFGTEPAASSQPTAVPVGPTLIESEPPTPSLLPMPIPTPTSSPPTKVAQSRSESSGGITINVRQMESLVHEMVNQERAKHGLGPLGYDDALADIARNHSVDMATQGYFAHENPAGEDPADRGNRQDYDCTKYYGTYYTFGIAENIFQGWLYSSITFIGSTERKNWNTTEDIAEDAVTGWMNSPGHRVNILDETYDLEGIGVAIADDDRVYITQNFC